MADEVSCVLLRVTQWVTSTLLALFIRSHHKCSSAWWFLTLKTLQVHQHICSKCCENKCGTIVYFIISFRLILHFSSCRIQKVEAARGDAEKIRLIGEAEATSIEAVGKAEAERMRLKASAYKQYGEAAMASLILETLPKVCTLCLGCSIQNTLFWFKMPIAYTRTSDHLHANCLYKNKGSHPCKHFLISVTMSSPWF